MDGAAQRSFVQHAGSEGSPDLIAGFRINFGPSMTDHYNYWTHHPHCSPLLFVWIQYGWIQATFRTDRWYRPDQSEQGRLLVETQDFSSAAPAAIKAFPSPCRRIGSRRGRSPSLAGSVQGSSFRAFSRSSWPTSTAFPPRRTSDNDSRPFACSRSSISSRCSSRLRRKAAMGPSDRFDQVLSFVFGHVTRAPLR